MSPKQILIVAIRLATIIWVIQTLNSGLSFYLLAEAENIDLSITKQIALYAGYVTCWLFLWFFPSTVAGWLLPESQQTEQPAYRHPSPWLNSGIILIGIWTLTNALSDAVYWYTFTTLAYDSYHQNSWTLLTAEQKSSIIITAIEICLGCILLFGATKISRSIQKIL